MPNRAGGTVKHRPVSGTTSSEAVTFHDAGESLPFAHSVYVDLVVRTENGHFDGIANLHCLESLCRLTLSSAIEPELP